VTGGVPLGSRVFPFGGFEPRRMPGRCRHDRCLPSWGYALSRRFWRCRSRVMGSAQPCPRGARRPSFRMICARTRRSVPGAGGVLPASPSTCLPAGGSSSEFTPPSGYRRRTRHAPPWRTTGARARADPPRVHSPSAHPDRSVHAHRPGLPHPVTFRLQGFVPS